MKNKLEISEESCFKMGEKRIGIIAIHDIQNHYVFYQTIIDLFSAHEITLFLHAKYKPFFKNYLDKDDVQLIYNNSNSSYRFIIKYYKIIKRQDLIIEEEPYSGSEVLLALLLNLFIKNKYITIHNCNKWFTPEFTYAPKKFMINILRQLLLQNVNGFIVISPNIKEYIEKVRPKLIDDVYFIPFSLLTNYSAKEINISTDENVINIVIPGIVDSQIRDYYGVLSAFRNYLNSSKGSKIKISLLGRLNSDEQKVKKIIKEINFDFPDSVLFWENFIDDNTFNKILYSSDFLLANIHPAYTKFGLKETYGSSKETGVFFHMINFEKKLIAVDEYRVIDYLSTNIISFKSIDDLVSIFKKIDNGE